MKINNDFRKDFDGLAFIGIFLFFLFFCGEPDLKDALVKLLFKLAE